MYKTTVTNRNSSSNKASFSSADNLLSLYSKIPDYAEVKHLGQSDFIRALEQLKEEFRRVRSSLYSSNSNEDDDDNAADYDEIERGNFNNNTCLETRLKVLNIRESSLSPGGKRITTNKNTYQDQTTLEIQGHQSQLHHSPSNSNYAINYINYNKPSRSLSFNFTDSKPRQNFSSDDEDENGADLKKNGENTPNSESSKWSSESSPDLGGYVYREFKEYEPPKNIEKR